MAAGLNSFPDTIHLNHFPAKLWHLVNDPTYSSICWDSNGEAIIIDQQLFEMQVLSPLAILSDSLFKTTNFSSFVRQLNLYGFKKAQHPDVVNRLFQLRMKYCYFYNPNFKRDHPELIKNLKRLTAENKARLQDNLSKNCQPSSPNMRSDKDGDGRDVKRVSPGDSSQLSPTNHEPIHPYYQNNTQAMKSSTGIPVPPQHPMRGFGPALPSPVFATGNKTRLSLHHPYTREATLSSSAVHTQCWAHGNYGSPNCTSLNPYNVQCQSAYYYPVYHWYHQNLVTPHMGGCSFQTGLFSPQSYQSGYLANMLDLRDCNDSLQKNENQNMKECDINLDAVFQIADEMMQTLSKTYLQKVEPLEEPV